MSAETPRRPCCFITGAAGGGIGTSTAVKFAQHGYDIVAGDIADTAGVKALVEAEGVICLGLRMDVCNKNSVDNAVEQALEKFGKVDVLCNNAAASLGSDILELSEEIWDQNITLALKSVYLVTRAVLPNMRQRRQGSIVNIASVNGQTGIGEEAYAAAKAGVINLTKNLAVRYGPEGIRVNCVSPGTIETNLWRERLANNPNTLANLKRYYPLGRIGQPEDVANAVYFLASQDASWITGVTLTVDGGLLAGNAGLIADLMGS